MTTRWRRHGDEVATRWRRHGDMTTTWRLCGATYCHTACHSANKPYFLPIRLIGSPNCNMATDLVAAWRQYGNRITVVVTMAIITMMVVAVVVVTLLTVVVTLLTVVAVVVASLLTVATVAVVMVLRDRPEQRFSP